MPGYQLEANVRLLSRSWVSSVRTQCIAQRLVGRQPGSICVLEQCAV